MSKKPKIEELIDVKEYVYKFDISDLLTEKTVLNTLIVWPNGDTEIIVERFGKSRIIIPIPQPLSLKAPENILKHAEYLSNGIHKVKCCRIENCDIYLGIEDWMVKYQAEELPPIFSCEGEEAVVCLHSFGSYFRPYSEFIRKDTYNENELQEFISAHPSSINFRRIQEMATSFYLSKKMPKLGKGEKSLETKKKILVKNYALYNLVKSYVDGKTGIDRALNKINESILENRGPNDDFYDALKRAFYRAKKEIEKPSSKPKANLKFLRTTLNIKGTHSNSYLLLLTPSSE